MTTLYFIYAAIAGLVLGSFYNVVGLRVPVGESIIRPRSHCTTCQRTLGAGELVPFFSYLVQKGTCKGCGTSISILYPLTEIGTAALFVAMPILIGWQPEVFVVWTLISLLILICITDLRYMLIPDKILLVFAILFVALRLVIPAGPWWNMPLGAVAGFTLLLLIALVSKNGMGGGDIKLFGVLGLALGWKCVLLAFLFSACFGTIIGLLGMLFGKVKRGEPMPFGPAIALGTIAAYLWGDRLLSWYFQLL
ncbi:prepilin peptidase [Paenibacillus aquistagni]|uniref:Leader peptidase (Prepilin peptidase) / N-methyltransferase n=1 Tax=Paenibacillus aquistagni TaxID=1852522 RepID=A0A1X7LS04_9BACL|nr:A24 family peptidase [Paenibacillus aquistagni]SMG56605.1 leader peptidase (prepilin peptidase) / N-methyltransferase [Paenibacillus aquistagni]